MCTMLDEDAEYWLVNLKEAAKYLSDEEFETVQGLIKKVDLHSEEPVFIHKVIFRTCKRCGQRLYRDPEDREFVCCRNTNCSMIGIKFRIHGGLEDVMGC